MVQQARILTGSFLGVIAMLALVVTLTLPVTDPDSALPLIWVVLAQVVLGVMLHGVIETVGYRTRPLPSVSRSAADTVTAARAGWQTTTMVRLALAESLALVSLAAAFIDGQAAVYYAGGAVSLILMAVHAWPWARPVAKVEASLDREGGRSGLAGLLGHGDHVIREL